ncbi:MAG: three component ABC system middle component [Sulfurifustis sp.]
MDLDFEFQLVHNSAFGAGVIWRFVRSYFDAKSRVDGPSLPILFLVLPMCLHARTVQAVHRMQLKSGLLKAVQDEPAIVVELNARIRELLQSSLRSINVAVASGLVWRQPTEKWPCLVPARDKLPSRLTPRFEGHRRVHQAANRFGYWFATIDLVPLLTYLRITSG